MIRKAGMQDAGALTKLSFDSKGYWGYPESYLKIWSDELTILPEYIKNNDLHVYTIEGEILGYYSIVQLKNDIEIGGDLLNRGGLAGAYVCSPSKHL